MSQVGGKIELSTKTKTSTVGAADDNTKTQIGRLTKTVSSSGKVGLRIVSCSHTSRIVIENFCKILNIYDQVSLSSKSGAAASVAGRPLVKAGALPRSRF